MSLSDDQHYLHLSEPHSGSEWSCQRTSHWAVAVVLLVFPDGFAQHPVHGYKLVTPSYFRSVGALISVWGEKMLVHNMVHLLDE